MIIQPKTREMENKDLLKVLDVLDFMAKWINEVGERDYRNAMLEVHSKTEKIRKRLTDGKTINGLDGRGNLQEGLIAEYTTFFENFIQNCETSDRLDSVQTSYFCNWAKTILGKEVTPLPADKNISGVKITEAPDRQVKSAREILEDNGVYADHIVDEDTWGNIYKAMEIYAQQYKHQL